MACGSITDVDARAYVLGMFRVGELPPGAFRVGGRIEGDEPPFALSDVAISIGEFSAEISGSVDTDDAELDISPATSTAEHSKRSFISVSERFNAGLEE